MAEQGSMTFTMTATQFVYVHLRNMDPITGQNYVTGMYSVVNMVKLVEDSDVQYSDILNDKYGRPMSNIWMTQPPDDGMSFFLSAVI